MRRFLLILTAALLCSAAPASASILWKADATSPIYQEWASWHTSTHCAVVTQPGVTDPEVFQIKDPTAPHGVAYQANGMADSGSGCYNHHQEVGQGNPSKTFSNGVDRQWHLGQDVWLAFQVKLGSNPSGRATIVQFTHPTGNGAPPWGLSQGGPNSTTDWNFWGVTDVTDQNNNSTSNYVGSFLPDVGKWVKFSIHMHLAQDSTGDFEVYSDLANPGGPMPLVFSRPNRFTMLLTASTAFLTMGNYDSAGTPMGHYAVAGLTVATDRASAEANAFGGVVPPPGPGPGPTPPGPTPPGPGPNPPLPAAPTAAYAYHHHGRKYVFSAVHLATCAAKPCMYTWSNDHKRLGTGAVLRIRFNRKGRAHIHLTVTDALHRTAAIARYVHVR